MLRRQGFDDQRLRWDSVRGEHMRLQRVVPLLDVTSRHVRACMLVLDGWDEDSQSMSMVVAQNLRRCREQQRCPRQASSIARFRAPARARSRAGRTPGPAFQRALPLAQLSKFCTPSFLGNTCLAAP